MSQYRSPGSQRAHRASDVFHQCLACESPNLLHFDGDAFCLYCDWNTITIREDARLNAFFSPEKEKTSKSHSLKCKPEQKRNPLEWNLCEEFQWNEAGVA